MTLLDTAAASTTVDGTAFPRFEAQASTKKPGPAMVRRHCCGSSLRNGHGRLRYLQHVSDGALTCDTQNSTERTAYEVAFPGGDSKYERFRAQEVLTFSHKFCTETPALYFPSRL